MNEKITIRATKSQYEDFKQSLIWRDIVEELESWKHGFEIESSLIVDNAASDNPSTASVLLHMGDLNGRVKAVNYVIGIIDMFINILEQEESDAARREQTDRSSSGE